MEETKKLKNVKETMELLRMYGFKSNNIDDFTDAVKVFFIISINQLRKVRYGEGKDLDISTADALRKLYEEY